MGPEFGSLTPWSTGSTRSRARPVTRCAPTSAGAAATGSSPSWSGMSPIDEQPARPRAGQPGTATRCTSSSTTCSSGCCGSGCSRPLRAAEPEAEGGFDVAGTRSGRTSVPRLAGGARPRRPPGRAELARHLGPRHRRSAGLGLAPRTAAPRRRRRPALTAVDERALAEWLADPAVPKAAARPQRDAACALRARLGRSPGSPATRRSRPTWRCPGTARSTWPTWCCATCGWSCGPGRATARAS